MLALSARYGSRWDQWCVATLTLTLGDQTEAPASRGVGGGGRVPVRREQKLQDAGAGSAEGVARRGGEVERWSGGGSGGGACPRQAD